MAAAELIETYHRECAALGRPAGRIIDTAGPLAIHVARDPERAWQQVGRHFLYEMNCYGKWASDAARAGGMNSPFVEVTDLAALAATGVYAVLTPDQCVELGARQHAAGRVFMLSPLAGGLPPRLAWESLELFAAEVAPRLPS